MITAPPATQFKECDHQWEPIEQPKETVAKLMDVYGQPKARVGLTCLNRCKLCGKTARLPVLVRGEVKKGE